VKLAEKRQQSDLQETIRMKLRRKQMGPLVCKIPKSIVQTALAFFLVLGFSHASSNVCADEAFRFWTTSDGTKSGTRLKLVNQNDTAVQLQREDNDKLVVFKIKGLSDADQKYVASLMASNQAPDTTPLASESGWPQWRGPNRDGVSIETGLADQWPSEGPRLEWSITGLGEGYSTPSVAGDRVYLLGTSGNTEQLHCLNLDDGKMVWSAPLGQKAGVGYPGPRGTPAIDGDAVYAMGSDGTLVCADLVRGRVRWQKNLKQFGGRHGEWGYAESPLIDGDKLICTPGGDRSTLLALRKINGTPMWQGAAGELSGGDQSAKAYTTAGYSSPIVAEISNVRQYIVFLRGGVVGFDANTGQPLWHYDAPANQTANCSTPICFENAVFAASGYGTGGGKANISGKGKNWNVDEKFFVNKFENHHGGFVLVDGFIYGTNNSVLMCVDWKSGDILWQDRCVGKGSITYADGNLIVRGERGEVAMVEATSESYRERGRFKQPERSDQNAWPHPVVANGKLFLHDWDRLFCYDLQ